MTTMTTATTATTATTHHRLRTAAGAALAVGLGLALLPAAPAVAATAPVPAALFGMHDADPASWPDAPVGSIRLWDSGVTWRQIETKPGVYDFSRLDVEVDTARANNARVLLVLGQTPRFHASKKSQRGAYGLGAASMPNEISWRRYVYAVVARYRGRGLDYQIWNEGNVASYWQGSAAQLARLTQLAATIIHRNDRAAIVVAPALATRLISQRAWLRTFYAQRVGGKKVSAYVDAVSLNLYPVPSGTPESSMTLLSSARIMLRQAGVTKPIWNTEINYGLLGGGRARKLTQDKQAAYVARTYVLNAAAGVRRVYWYGWDLQNLANTELTVRNGVTPTRAGTAYRVVRTWLLGGRVRSVTTDSRGTYTVTMGYPGGVKRIFWNPTRRVTVRVVPSARASVGLYGVSRPLSGGEMIGVGQVPVLVRSAR